MTNPKPLTKAERECLEHCADWTDAFTIMQKRGVQLTSRNARVTRDMLHRLETRGLVSYDQGTNQWKAIEYVQPRSSRQDRVHAWCIAAFGKKQSKSKKHRGLRFLEEAIELFQACEGNPEQAHTLIDYIFARPKGDLWREFGGAGLTLLALAATAGVDADAAENSELERVLAKPIEHFQQRNKVKDEAGFKP